MADSNDDVTNAHSSSDTSVPQNTSGEKLTIVPHVSGGVGGGGGSSEDRQYVYVSLSSQRKFFELVTGMIGVGGTWVDVGADVAV